MGSDEQVDKVAVLAKIRLFGQLPENELARLVAFVRLEHHPAGTELFRKGDPGSNLMVVLRGCIKVCTHSAEGQELVLNLIDPGEVVGEIAVLDGAGRTADAVTLEDTDVLVLDRRDFMPFLQAHPESCMSLMMVLCQKVRRTSQFLEDTLFLEGPSRLARLLVYLAEEYGRPVDGGVRISLQRSQQQLADMIGMARESVNKQLRQWRKENLVRMHDGHYEVTDLDTLREL